MTTAITEKGQVTIPVEFRRQFGLKKGTRCMFLVRDGELVLVPLKGKMKADDLRNFLSSGLTSSDQFALNKQTEKQLEL